MLEPDVFLTELFVMVDDFCQTLPPTTRGRGRKPSLSASEVVTLSLFGQFSRFLSERRYYRWARKHLLSAFPKMPVLSQYNRLCRKNHHFFTQFFTYLTEVLDAQNCSYEVLDSSGVATRDSKRRGKGWLPEDTSIGKCTRLGWFEGFKLLVACNPEGMITGFGIAQANTSDQAIAEPFLALRAYPHSHFSSVGKRAKGRYLADKGFGGRKRRVEWWQAYRAEVLTEPPKHSMVFWYQCERKQLRSKRQIIESVFSSLFGEFRLGSERPHDYDGFYTRVTAKMALHNFCIWLNRRYSRAYLAFSELVSW